MFYGLLIVYVRFAKTCTHIAESHKVEISFQSPFLLLIKLGLRINEPNALRNYLRFFCKK